MRHILAIVGIIMAATGGAAAQDISVPSVTVANPGGYANPLKLDTDRYQREKRKAKSATVPCSADALPIIERRQMERDYARRLKTDGKESADLWAAEQGRRFRARLVAQGVCPSKRGDRQSAVGTRPSRSAGRDRKERKCTKTVMQARNIANPGGGAMSMIMVPVCVN